MKQVEEILNRWRTTRNVTESGALFTAVEELRKVFNAGQQCIEMYQHPFAQIAHSRCKLDAGHEGMHNSGTYRWLNMPHPAAVEMPEMCSSKAADGVTACDYTKGHTGPHRNVQAYKEWKGSTVMAEEFLRVRDLVEPIPLEELEHMATTVRSFYEMHGCRAAWLREKMAEALEDGGKLLRLFNDVELTKRLLSVMGTPLSVLMTLQTEDK